jgi:hypothetical protein
VEEKKTFEEICQKYAIWVISYSSPTWEKPVFFIWYTDPGEEGEDKLVVFPTDQIWATQELNLLAEKLERDLPVLRFPKKFPEWLVTIQQMQPVADVAFDLASVEEAIRNKYLTAEVLKELVNFINLFGDYFHQLEENDYFESLREDGYIDEAWNYYYDYIFWPEYGNPANIDPQNKPEPDIDTESLLRSVIAMREAFEERIQVVG